ncbi:MAG: hypothetical protein H5U36_08005, partial [Candidatus Caldatribacterium sp.]|nr:hypothetical protein [Candidatus Caldatribacterium sp.]
FLEKGVPLSRIEILRRFLSHFLAAYRRWKRDGDFSPWVEEYNRRFALLGRPVAVGGGKEPVTGIALGVDEHGALRIREGGRERTITWGEIE